MKVLDWIHIDLFAGVGGFHEGLLRSGFKFKKHYFSEIDKHAIANYKYNFPDAEYIGSVLNVSGTAIRERHINAKIIVTFGWPCQDNSIAGKRKGHTAGSRSSLLFEAGRIISECKCELFIAENVKGLFSVNEGNDFYEAIRFLTYLNSDSPQYTVEMQLLNTSWILPQNRERTYFVGHIGTRSIKRIFPITENDFGTIEGESNATTVRTLTGGGAFRRDAQQYDVTSCVNDRGVLRDTEISTSIDANYHKGTDYHGARTMIKIKSNTKGGEQIAEVGDSINFSMPNSKTRRGRVGKQIAQTLDTQINIGVIVLQKTHGSTTTVKNNETGTLQRGGSNVMDKVPNIVIQLNTSLEDSGSQTYQQNRVYDTKGILPAISARNGGNTVPKILEVSPTLSGFEHGTNGQLDRQLLKGGMIRRLTEVECERLQGYPDNWTEFGIYEKQVWINKKLKTFEIVQQKHKIPRTQRYKLCGNAVTVDIVELIGIKLLKNNF